MTERVKAADRHRICNQNEHGPREMACEIWLYSYVLDGKGRILLQGPASQCVLDEAHPCLHKRGVVAGTNPLHPKFAERTAKARPPRAQ